MLSPGRNRKSAAPDFRLIFSVLAVLLAIASASCGNRNAKAGEKSGNPAKENAAQRTFASPDAAGNALFEAAKADDKNALLAIFGPQSKDLLSSGDAVKDKNTLQAFVNAYREMHRWSKNKAGGEILYIGADNFPFPLPLDQNASGQWSFNTAAGKDEILARRIGDGELTTIGVLSEIATAEQAYFRQNHQFTQKFVSDQGEHDGLYWPVAEGQRPSPLGPLGETAKLLGYTASEKREPFEGYYYKILTQQGEKAKGGAEDYLHNGRLTGGFAVVAWPAKYQDSGIMTFLVGEDGVIYQKDLGEKTAELATNMADYNPGDGWSVVLAPEPISTRTGVVSARKE